MSRVGIPFERVRVREREGMCEGRRKAKTDPLCERETERKRERVRVVFSIFVKDPSCAAGEKELTKFPAHYLACHVVVRMINLS